MYHKKPIPLIRMFINRQIAQIYKLLCSKDDGSVEYPEAWQEALILEEEREYAFVIDIRFYSHYKLSIFQYTFYKTEKHRITWQLWPKCLLFFCRFLFTAVCYSSVRACYKLSYYLVKNLHLPQKS